MFHATAQTDIKRRIPVAEMKITKQHMQVAGSESNELTVHESKTSQRNCCFKGNKPSLLTSCH